MEKEKIFISYSRKDKEQVFELVRQIEQQVGIKCWIDINGIESGQMFENVIMRAINRCEVVIAMISSNSCISENVKDELAFAFTKKKRIVPIILDSDQLTDDWFIFKFRRADFIVASNPEHISKLMRDLYSWLAPENPILSSFSQNSAQEPQNNVTKQNGAANMANLKVLPNLTCKVLIDCEEKGIATAEKLMKIPLPVGEYYAEFISTENSSDSIAQKILLEHDKIEKVDLLSVKQKREKAEENEKSEDFISKKQEKNKNYQFKESLTTAKIDGKWGCFDLNGKEVIPCIYDNIDDFRNGRAKVKYNDKWGYINECGKEIIPCKYDYIGNFKEGIAMVLFNKKYGSIDKYGKEIIPCKYDDIENFREGIAKVRLNNKYGYITNLGKEITPCKYDDGCHFIKGMAMVKFNDKWGYIDSTGKEVFPCIHDSTTSLMQSYFNNKED